ncbi:putative acylesterase/phospholipase RssA [Microvirga lupini]|uniref:Putative acylesterase/phospholipase RssA n=1 Tax=Microvirga lupini TaxID=420324 RepID=A0A7W4VIZ9_9HYPH|nr:hypothetical protein [Microvirga lupini]MBB3017640.1 putative acylesterase/phospholipase RssA [Microvirga lupini]
MRSFWWLMAGLGCCGLALVAMIAGVAVDATPRWLAGCTMGAVAASMVCALLALSADRVSA